MKTTVNDDYNIALRDKFINEIIFPRIEYVKNEATSITLLSTHGWFKGDSFVFSKEYSETKVNIHLTNLILTKLHKDGFTCQFKTKKQGNQFMDGEGTIEISWNKN